MEGSLQLRGLEVYGYHGLYEKERLVRQKFKIDIELHYQIKDKMSFELEEVIDYEQIPSLVDHIMKNSEELVETIASKILHTILNQYPEVDWCKIRIMKYPIIPAKFESICIELQKSKFEL